MGKYIGYGCCVIHKGLRSNSGLHLLGTHPVGEHFASHDMQEWLSQWILVSFYIDDGLRKFIFIVRLKREFMKGGRVQGPDSSRFLHLFLNCEV